MRWASWLPRSRPRRLCVVGLDVGPDVYSLALPEGLLAHGEVMQSVELGLWLRTYLEAGDYQPERAYLGLDSAFVSSQLVPLAAVLPSTPSTLRPKCWWKTAGRS